MDPVPNTWSLGPDVPGRVTKSQCLALPGGKILAVYSIDQPSATAAAAVLNTLSTPPAWERVTVDPAVSLDGAGAINLKQTAPGKSGVLLASSLIKLSGPTQGLHIVSLGCMKLGRFEKGITRNKTYYKLNTKLSLPTS